MSSLACSEGHSAEEKEHGQRMVQRVQLHMHEGTLGRYRKGGRGSSQEPENVPRSRTGQLVELSTVRTTNSCSLYRGSALAGAPCPWRMWSLHGLQLSCVLCRRWDHSVTEKRMCVSLS